MTYRVQVDPEQIKALNDGEEVTVLLRMEPQPDGPVIACWTSDPWGTSGDGACPVAVGDTVEAKCRYYDCFQGYCWHDSNAEVQCFGKDICSQSAIVRHIVHREKREPQRLALVHDRPGDDLRTEDIAGYGHYWEVTLGPDTKSKGPCPTCGGEGTCKPGFFCWEG
jgi:hypothetical protein